MKIIDLYPAEWTQLIDTCGFTREEMTIIDVYRQYGNEWKLKQYADELCMSCRTLQRRVANIRNKINGVS